MGMNCKEATKSYEAWLAIHTRLIEADLRLKHQQMSADIFSFMRATFYRWVEMWTEQCAPLANAPAVLAIGDLHVENFGTWRDEEGRIVWGVNDFDEAFSLPYTNDLVRLAASAHLAISANSLTLKPADACAAILRGYATGLNDGGSPFVLAEKHEWLRSAVLSELRDPLKFWNKLDSLPTVKTRIPGKAMKALAGAWPSAKIPYRVIHRVSGLGSLGRQRFTALGEWNGGQIAREAKALVPSACVWAGGMKDGPSQYDKILGLAIRCPDPSLELRKNWVLRRLSPDCSRVELAMLPRDRDQHKLLAAMGQEIANIHLGSKRTIQRVKQDLAKRADGWLHQASKTMVQAITKDWQSWCVSEGPHHRSQKH